jgi:hypothetical protein
VLQHGGARGPVLHSVCAVTTLFSAIAAVDRHHRLILATGTRPEPLWLRIKHASNPAS